MCSSDLDPHTPARPPDPHSPARPPDPHTLARPPDPPTPARPPDPHTLARPPDPHTPARPPAGPAVERVLGLSKKDALQRRSELLGSGKGSLSVSLTSLCSARAGSLIRLPHACDLIVELGRGGEGQLLLQLCPEGVSQVMGGEGRGGAVGGLCWWVQA